MSKASVVIKVGDDVWKIAQNVWKAIKGSPHIKQVSSKTPAKTISKKSLENKIQLQRIKIGAKNRETGEALKKLGKESKVKLKSGPLDVKPKVVKPKVVKSKPSPWAKSTTKKTPSEASSLAKADVARGPKITPTNAKSGNIVTRGGKRAGVVVMSGGKKFIKTKTGKLIAIAGAGAGGYYLGKAIDKSIASSGKPPNGAATTTPIKKPPKPSGPVTTAPAPPSVLSAQAAAANQTKPPKPSGMSSNGGPPQTQATKSEPKTLEQKLKAKWVKRRGGEPAFGKKGSEGAWKTHVLDMRRGSEVGLTYTDQQNYDKIIEERKELASATKKKRGGVIKRNKGGPVRGVGKALRGFGNNSIYSNKMY